MICPKCHSEIGDESAYCSFCGVPLTKTDRPSDFELGKIHALSLIKSDIWRWFLGFLAVITFFGALGLLQIARNAAEDAINNEIKPELKMATKDVSELKINAAILIRDAKIE